MTATATTLPQQVIEACDQLAQLWIRRGGPLQVSDGRGKGGTLTLAGAGLSELGEVASRLAAKAVKLGLEFSSGRDPRKLRDSALAVMESRACSAMLCSLRRETFSEAKAELPTVGGAWPSSGVG